MTELLHLLTDWHHWAFEGVSDLLFAGIGVLWHTAWVRRHDRSRHGG